MKKIIGTALIAALLAGTAAQAQDIAPLDTTAATQGSLPVLSTIPPGAIVIGAFVILAGVVIGISSDGTS